jgi:type I restriction enzyme S subunit
MSAWPELAFGDLVADVTGGNIKTLQSDYLSSGEFPIIDQGQTLIGGYTNDAERVCKADLPVIIFGDHTKCFKFVDFPFCLGADGTKILRPKKSIDERYLFYALQRIHIPDAGYSRHFKYLKEGRIPLPPLDEQKRIAAILDQADELRRKRQRAIDRLNELGQAIFHEMFGDLASPESFSSRYATTALGSVVQIKGGGTPSKANKSFYNGDIPWVSPKDMKSWEIVDAQDKITAEAIEKSATNLIPENSVLLVNRSGILKHTLPVGITRRPVAINQDLKALICSSRIRPDFLAHLVKAAEPIVLKWVRATTADNFPIDNLKGLIIPLPDLGIQDRFCDIVSGISGQLKVALTSKESTEFLIASLQHRAFQGDL